MQIMLIRYTEDPEFIAALAAKLCHSSINDNILRKIIKLGHLSVIEHVSFTYLLEGISRVTTHQLVRHRLASYSQQSHRYTRIEENDFICPHSIRNNKEAYSLFQKNIKDNLETYNKLIEMGIKKEDARYIIPQAVTSNIMVTMNARELLNFFRLRCTKNAQWEIRELANRMIKLAKEKSPIIFENVGCDK